MIGAQDVVHAGVHRLTAFYGDVHLRSLKIAFMPSPAHTATMAYGLSSFLLLFSSSSRSPTDLAVLFHHILDLDAVQLAELERRFEGAVGIVGVDVRLDEVEVADDQDAVADGHEIVAVLVDVGLGDRGLEVRDEELRAILEGDVLVVVVQRHELLRRPTARGGSGLCRVDDGDLAARERGVHALHDGDEPSSARVHDARFCEHGEHLGSLLQDGFARLYDLGEELLELLSRVFWQAKPRSPP